VICLECCTCYTRNMGLIGAGVADLRCQSRANVKRDYGE
jgi:hypothetical protein